MDVVVITGIGGMGLACVRRRAYRLIFGDLRFDALTRPPAKTF